MQKGQEKAGTVRDVSGRFEGRLGDPCPPVHATRGRTRMQVVGRSTDS